MKHMPAHKKKNLWNATVVLFGIIHSIVALIFYELLWFQPCADGLFLGACGIGKRMFVTALFVGWVVFLGSFTAIMFYGKRKFGKAIIPVSYLGALIITVGSEAMFALSGLLLYFATLLR